MFCPNCGKENDDSVRHCQNCGSFIPDLSILGNEETPKMSQEQPMTFSALSQDNREEFQNDTSRYQEYTMADVVAKKSHKKLIVWLVVLAAVLVLSVAAFFVVRFIINSNSLSKIKSDPTKYVFASYQTTAKNAANSMDAVRALTAGQNRQETTKTTITAGGVTQQSICAVDAQNKKFYYSTSFDTQKNANGAKFSSGMPSSFSAECYATLDRLVLNSSVDGQKADYYVDLNNLRQDAAASFMGPQGENVFHLSQENYDMAMDVYEFIYNNLKKDNDPFGLESLGKKLCEDFDKCGNVNVSSEKVTIDDVTADAFVVTHTFNNTEIIAAVVNDVKDWVKTNVNINANVNQMIDDALAKADVSQLIDQLNSSGALNNTELMFKHCINKNQELMQTEIILHKDNQGFKIVLCFGADPAHSKKSSIKIATVDSNNSEMVLQSITTANESTDAEEKMNVSYIGLLLNGSTAFTRNRTTGDFTLTNNMTLAVSGLGGSAIVPEKSKSGTPSMNFSVSGNLKVTDGSVVLSYSQPSADGSEVKVEVSVSNKAEIKELTSDNNLLKAASEELTKNFGALFGQQKMKAISPIATVNV